MRVLRPDNVGLGWAGCLLGQPGLLCRCRGGRGLGGLRKRVHIRATGGVIGRRAGRGSGRCAIQAPRGVAGRCCLRVRSGRCSGCRCGRLRLRVVAAAAQRLLNQCGVIVERRNHFDLIADASAGEDDRIRPLLLPHHAERCPHVPGQISLDFHIRSNPHLSGPRRLRRPPSQPA